MYRPSYLIEAYVRPEKYWLLYGGLLANPIYSLFLAAAYWRRQNERQVLRMYSAANRPIPLRWTDVGHPQYLPLIPLESFFPSPSP
jgi:hypothetical protein